MCKDNIISTIMRNIFKAYLLVAFLISTKLYGQVSIFPYNEGFESIFTTGVNVEFIPNWTGNEVTTSNRIFRDGTNQNVGTGALAVIPISSFTGEIILKLNFSNLTDAIVNFVARSIQNGSGTRPAIVHFSTSVDGGITYTTPVLIGSATAFPNATTPYLPYSYQFPSMTGGATDVRLKITVAQSPDSAGTTARFVMDDFIISGNSFNDTIPPFITSVAVISVNELDIKFSEPIEPLTAQNTINYFVDNSIGNPQAAIVDGTDPLVIHLTFGNTFTPGILYEITINNIEDLNGNVLTNSSSTFGIFTVQPGDIVINEIMADPDPPVELPNFEYLELYNKKNVHVDLTGWTITIGANVRIFGNVSIPADSFLIVGTAAATAALQAYGPVATVFTSSTTLTNGGISLILKDDQGNIINSVTYDDSWYQDPNKDDGGWSLELINPDIPCPGVTNWIASNDLSGGTPGRTNSVSGSFTDTEPPRLLRAAAITSSQVTLTFNELMDTSSLADAALYSIDNGIGNPLSVSMHSGSNEVVVINLSQPISTGIVYTVTVASTVRDCSGNLIGPQRTARFGLAEPVNPLDIVINEILFNPYTGGSDFVELYNRSNKIIDLFGMKIANADVNTGNLSTIREITPESYPLFPGDYVVLTANPDNIKSNYYTPNPDNFINVALPSYTNASGVAVLTDANIVVTDKFSYDEKMHFPLLTDVKGVSLERVNPDRPTQDATNWHSASQNAGFATPSYRNSQYNDSQLVTDEMTVTPEIFSPDNDGYNDIANIHFNFSAPGYVVTIAIFDSKGRLVRTLAQNILLGTSESIISWDGINEKNEKAPVGVYIIFAEAFNAAGDTKKFKKTVVLATKFN